MVMPIGYTLRRYLNVMAAMVEATRAPDEDNYSVYWGRFNRNLDIGIYFEIDTQLGQLGDDIYSFFPVKEIPGSIFKNNAKTIVYKGCDPGYPDKLIGCPLNRATEEHTQAVLMDFIGNTEAFYEAVFTNQNT